MTKHHFLAALVVIQIRLILITLWKRMHRTSDDIRKIIKEEGQKK